MATNTKTSTQGKNSAVVAPADATKRSSKRTYEGASLILRAFEKRRQVVTTAATATEEDNTSYILGYN